MANEVRYRYRNKDYTYDEFMAGPGGKLSTDEAYAALDRASGATKTRRALQRAMTSLGWKLVSADANGVVFEGGEGTQKFDTFGEVEKFLLGKGAIKDEKAEAAKKAAEKKEKVRARARAKKEADAKKAAEKKAQERAKEKARAKAKKEAEAKRETEKKAAAKKKEAEKKAAAKAAEKAKASAAKQTAAKKPAAKKASASKTAAKKPATSSARRPGRPPKAAAAAKKGSRSANVASKNLKDSGFVIRFGRREYTQERLKNLALDSYKYDMGGNPKGAKVDLYVNAEDRKCYFIVNGKEKGEFDL